ncbi:hypothetical protein GCM10023196_053530 [Actinoallomurus vinaceus]|uniref:Uncharacterized protein n=1 Tax=Actinoallomurus vinaceus TaxID=1080074 RepID=A0ABP8UFV0_9ACTN
MINQSFRTNKIILRRHSRTLIKRSDAKPTRERRLSNPRGVPSSRPSRVAQSVRRRGLRRASYGGAHSVIAGSSKPCPFAPARLRAPALTASRAVGRPGPPSLTVPPTRPAPAPPEPIRQHPAVTGQHTR